MTTRFERALTVIAKEQPYMELPAAVKLAQALAKSAPKRRRVPLGPVLGTYDNLAREYDGDFPDLFEAAIRDEPLVNYLLARDSASAAAHLSALVPGSTPAEAKMVVRFLLDATMDAGKCCRIF